MTHELKHIIHQALLNQERGLKNVLATVVFLEGSSYRKPGVRMLICEDGTMIGAVSGGCVENEIKRSAQSVFKNGEAKVITYDGRYRLGCEGVLYILIEPFEVSNALHEQFQKILKTRRPFKIESYYQPQNEASGDFGSFICFDNDVKFKFNETFHTENLDSFDTFSQTLNPSFKLVIIGGEHDAVKLCEAASFLGWEVDVITSIKDPKQFSDFPGAKSVVALTPEIFDLKIDDETAIVLMTHNYALDLKYLLKLVERDVIYIGILGSRKRKEQLQNDLINYNENFDETILSKIYSPSGLNIGAITPEEIALSILSEILTIIREKEPLSLRETTTKTSIK